MAEAIANHVLDQEPTMSLRFPCRQTVFSLAIAVALPITTLAQPAAVPAPQATEQDQADAARRAAQAEEAAARARAEQEQGRRGTRRGRSGRGTAFPGASGFGSATEAFSQPDQRDGRPFPPMSQPSATMTPAGEPKDLISLNLWVLTIEMPRDKVGDDLVAGLAARANELSTVVGSRDDVRVLIGKLSVAGILKRSREFRIMAMDGQQAYLQSGANEPQITASSIVGGARAGAGGGRVNSITYNPIGTLIHILPGISQGSNIDVQLQFSASEIEEAPSVLLAEQVDVKPIMATRITTQQLQTNTRVKNGTAVLLQSDVISEPAGTANVRTQLIILGASIIPALE
jgi:hypothetical protein